MARLLTWIQTALIPAMGPGGLFLVAFLDSSLLSLPEVNDLLVVAGSAAQPRQAWLFVLLSTLGSLAGCLVLWHLGKRGGEGLLARRFGQARMERTRAAYARWKFWGLALPALLPPPVPLKVFVFAAGAFGMSGLRLSVTITLARGLRYALWATLGVLYGGSAVAMLGRFDRWFAQHTQIVLLASLGLLLLALAIRLLRRRGREGGEPLPSAGELG